MKAKALALPVVVALALAGLASTGRAAADNPPGNQPSREITIPGTVISSSHDKLVIRTDAHRFYERLGYQVIKTQLSLRRVL